MTHIAEINRLNPRGYIMHTVHVRNNQITANPE